ncbi:transporter [Bradyrhizobium jicamae]|uniref:Transporter n=1 Tax=Bradyrhizobium jicamae TaxID=280332 RepID=A0ABS5FIR0_9BRAD|nr:transporter [Bradyrhizobium jicamae]MBR0796276.1 transporter [Bradyrhizobium jicamae]
MIDGKANWDLRRRALLCALVAGSTALAVSPARSDEAGISAWLPGTFGSMAAVPTGPGWSAATVYYHTSVSASGNVAASREIEIGRFTPTATASLSANLNATGDLFFFAPTYTFATPVLGGQAAVGFTGVMGRADSNLNGTLAATIPPFGLLRTDSISDSVTGVGDLYPIATLKWNQGVNNWMVYMSGDAPVGAYDHTRIINLGIGHGSIDGGGGYTYFNPQTGNEFSAVAGFTYNFKNTATDYQNGVDFHLDLATSKFVSKQVFVGLVGYAYEQLSGDSGSGAKLGPFKSRVEAIGPQIGYVFPIGTMQGVINAKGYWDIETENRAKGWNTWLTFAITNPPPPPPAAAKLITK